MGNLAPQTQGQEAMSARDKISQVARSLRYSSNNSDELADAILAAMPDLIAPLVWEQGGRASGSYIIENGVKYGKFCVLYQNGARGGGPIKHGKNEIWHDTIEAAYDAANAHHVAVIMAEFPT
jgi:hypothetical protein